VVFAVKAIVSSGPQTDDHDYEFKKRNMLKVFEGWC
jgi:translation initiation factor IF-3